MPLLTAVVIALIISVRLAVAAELSNRDLRVCSHLNCYGLIRISLVNGAVTGCLTNYLRLQKCR